MFEKFTIKQAILKKTQSNMIRIENSLICLLVNCHSLEKNPYLAKHSNNENGKYCLKIGKLSIHQAGIYIQFVINLNMGCVYLNVLITKPSLSVINQISNH